MTYTKRTQIYVRLHVSITFLSSHYGQTSEQPADTPTDRHGTPDSETKEKVEACTAQSSAYLHIYHIYHTYAFIYIYIYIIRMLFGNDQAEERKREGKPLSVRAVEMIATLMTYLHIYLYIDIDM